MTGKRLTSFAGLCVIVWLLLVHVSFTTPGVTAQGGTQEQEPNDSKKEAQLLGLASGDTVVAEGDVAQGDGGSFVQELEAFFSNGLLAQRDRLEDWYAVDVNGALEFGLRLEPSRRSNLDVSVFTDISEAVFSDGLASTEVAMTTERLEQEPNRIYYTYSTRAEEVIDLPPFIPPTSRHYLAVSNLDPIRLAPANYRLRLSSPARGTTRAVIHDTSGPGFFAPVIPSDLGSQRLRALQRITPVEYPARLDRVELLQFDLGDTSQEGERIDVVVLVDPQGTGNPASATQVLRRTVTIQALDAINSYSVVDANIVVNSGDIYAGCEIVQRPSDLHIPFDIDKAGYGRSFISTDEGQSYGLLRTAGPEAGIPLISNVGIDAVLTINPIAREQMSASRQPVLVRKTNDRATRAIKRISGIQLQ